MTLLVDFAALAVLAFCTASLSRYIDFCMESGNILHWWYKLVIKISGAKFDIHGNLIKDNGLYKPLGGCILCFNFWLGILPYIWLCGMLDYDGGGLFLMFFGYVGLSAYFLQLQEKTVR